MTAARHTECKGISEMLFSAFLNLRRNCFQPLLAKTLSIIIIQSQMTSNSLSPSSYIFYVVGLAYYICTLLLKPYSAERVVPYTSLLLYLLASAFDTALASTLASFIDRFLLSQPAHTSAFVTSAVFIITALIPALLSLTHLSVG